jgi:hypothetical protein
MLDDHSLGSKTPRLDIHALFLFPRRIWELTYGSTDLISYRELSGC